MLRPRPEEAVYKGSPGMKLSTAACSDVGLRRQANEDSFAIVPELGLYLVADGMGGHKAGKIASEMATEQAQLAIQALRGAAASPSEKLRQAVSCANREIHVLVREAEPNELLNHDTIISQEQGLRHCLPLNPTRLSGGLVASVRSVPRAYYRRLTPWN